MNRYIDILRKYNEVVANKHRIGTREPSGVAIMNGIWITRQEHEWVDVGFMRPKLVCKHCDTEKEGCHTNYCPESISNDDVDKDKGWPLWANNKLTPDM